MYIYKHIRRRALNLCICKRGALYIEMKALFVEHKAFSHVFRSHLHTFRSILHIHISRALLLVCICTHWRKISQTKINLVQCTS